MMDAATKTILTGTELDKEVKAQLIGKKAPVFVGGQARMGARIIEGPFLRNEDDVGLCDMIVSPCMVADPTASRSITSLNFNGTQSWTLADGFLGDAFSGMEVNFLYGSETQTPFASSISRFGDRAVPYRSHVCIELKNIPLAVFGNVTPFISPFLYQSDYLTRNNMLHTVAQFCRFGLGEREFAVSGQDVFAVLIDSNSFPGYVGELQRTIGRNWNIRFNDKFRVFENTSTVTPISLTRDDIIEDSIDWPKIDPRDIDAVRYLGYIDTGRDNDFNKVKARRARFPIALTESEGSNSYDIPVGMTANDAKSAVNRSLLVDDIGRDRFVCRVLPHMRGLEGGDILDLSEVDEDVEFPTGRILSVARNAANFTADIVVERIEMALLPTGPSITSDGGGATASISIDEGETEVTTVTATAADDTGAFSIVGGVDAAMFDIDPDTGELTFITPPDFEAPADFDSDNVYEVVVQVEGDGLFGTQAISVTVTDVADGGPAGSPFGLLLALTAT